MHELLNISTIAVRNLELNVGWHVRIRSNKTTLAGELLDRLEHSSSTSIPRTSAFRIMMNSSYWQEIFNLTPYTGDKSSMIRNINSISCTLKNTIRRSITRKQLKSDSSIPALIQPQKNGKADSIIYASFLKKRNIQRQIILWKLGSIANHQTKCSNCHGNTSRLHVCQCTGISHFLQRFFHDLNPDSNICVLDQALGQVSFQNNPDMREKINILSSALIMIQSHCFAHRTQDWSTTILYSLDWNSLYIPNYWLF
jgi:hypothetical protein